jgi:hypothetical protein
MATQISLNRGEHLAATVRIQDGGANVFADVANGYSIEAQMSNINGGEELYDLGATFSNGAGVVNYDTANLDAGIYYFDFKLGFPTGEERWTDGIELKLAEPITKP